MIKGVARTFHLAAVAALVVGSTPGWAAEPVTGLWYDHTGRGAVEISDCGGKLCGRLVWLKDPKHKEGCNLQIFGDVKPVATGKWDGGWIIDPEKSLSTKYSVELTLVNPKSLKVVGYLGTKLLSETMMWQRAPKDLKRCGA
jgi:uncharacterized protein (DUF2147 family)